MFVVIDEAAEQRLFELAGALSTSSTPAFLENFAATVNRDEELVVVSLTAGDSGYLRNRPGAPVPCYGFRFDEGGHPSPPAVSPIDVSTIDVSTLDEARPLLLLGLGSGESPALASIYCPEGSSPPQACEIEVVRLETDLFSRLRGIFDTRVLAPKTVSVIGLGSGGSLGAVELAKSGVGGFILVDFDRLKAHNISRHVCGLGDVGRYKTRAVRDAILQHNPLARVDCHEVDITEAGDLLDQIVAASDLVVVATDNELSRYLINDACLAANKPAVYGGAYERAFAGEVIRVIPGEAGCYACVRQGLASTMRSISSQQVFDYTDDSEFQAEPGLGIDVSFIAMIHAKLALMTLLKDTTSTLGNIDADMIIWINSARPQDGELFERPLTRHLVRVPRSENCPACREFFEPAERETGETDPGEKETGLR